MTLDDLEKIYSKAWAESGSHRAGIRAVVEALRDEICKRYGFQKIWDDFDDILGDAGEKAAGDRTRESAAGGLGSGQAPAADLGPHDDGVLIGNQNVEAIINDLHDEQKNKAADLCEGCPPVGYPTDKTRCTPCPRRPADPSEVCEWSVSRDPEGEGYYETRCGNGWMMAVSPPPARDGYKFCPSCGKPITFKEATK